MFHDFKLLGTDAGLDFDIHLDTGKRFYCLFGANGVGKTNLLQNLARTMLAVHSMFLREKGVYRYGMLFRNRSINEHIKEWTFALPLDIEVSGTRIKDRSRDGWGFAVLQLLYENQLLRQLVQSGESPTPLVIDRPIVVVGTSNRGHSTRLDKSEMHFVGSNEEEFLHAFDRLWSATTDDSVQTQSIAAWIASRLLVNPAFVVGSVSRAEEVVALCDLLAELDPVFRGLVDRTPGQTKLGIAFKEGRLFVGPTPIDKLATGYVAVVKILQEIISAYGAWGGLTGAQDLRALNGIVLIDELEAHLHPRWQVGLVPLLKRAFPNTTFVVCTHSPLIVAQTEEGEAYELIRQDNSVTSRRLGSPRDWYLADVYANAFHVELPTPGSTPAEDEPALIDLLIDFSARVKDHLAKRDDATRTEAMALHDQIAARLPDDDPRRSSLNSLRSLLG